MAHDRGAGSPGATGTIGGALAQATTWMTPVIQGHTAQAMR